MTSASRDYKVRGQEEGGIWGPCECAGPDRKWRRAVRTTHRVVRSPAYSPGWVAKPCRKWLFYSAGNPATRVMRIVHTGNPSSSGEACMYRGHTWSIMCHTIRDTVMSNQRFVARAGRTRVEPQTQIILEALDEMRQDMTRRMDL